MRCAIRSSSLLAAGLIGVAGSSSALALDAVQRPALAALPQVAAADWQVAQPAVMIGLDPAALADDDAVAMGRTDESVQQVPLVRTLPPATLNILVEHLRSVPSPQDNEASCLAKAVYFESRGEPLTGQLAVANVILNRRSSGRFGQSICEIISQPAQFSFVRGGQLGTPKEGAVWRTAQAIAQIALNGWWSDVSARATHFHATYVQPGWNDLMKVASIGQHIFYAYRR
jgi:spore germination cell wall hydrolase CwlJ-like protein